MRARVSILSSMNKLSTEQRTRVVAALVEGNGLRATARMTGVARMTVEKLLRDLGAASARYQDEHLRNLSCRRVQCDEIWSFVYSKAKNVPADQAWAIRRRGRVDMDGHRRRHEADRVVARWHAGCRRRLRLHDGRREPAQAPRAADDGRHTRCI